MNTDRALPLLLRPGLRIAFIGYNPGIESGRRGHYYAFRGNVFWRQLSASGLVPRDTTCEDDASLMDLAGIGFTDLCLRATVRAGDLTQGELREGAARLHGELLANQPGVAVFNGRRLYEVFARHALGVARGDLAYREWGRQPERIGTTVPWVIPNSSGLASRWHRDRANLLAALAAELPPTAAAPSRRTPGRAPVRPARS